MYVTKCITCRSTPKWLVNDDRWGAYALSRLNTRVYVNIRRHKGLSRTCSSCYINGARSIKVLCMLLEKLGVKMHVHEWGNNS